MSPGAFQAIRDGVDQLQRTYRELLVGGLFSALASVIREEEAQGRDVATLRRLEAELRQALGVQ
jgi:hypothetical protein